MQHNYRRGFELSAFQILTEIIGGNLSGFLNKFLKLHFINKLHWTSHSWKKKPGNSQHCFISLFFLALNIFSAIPFLTYIPSCCFISAVMPAVQEAAIRHRPAHTHSLQHPQLCALHVLSTFQCTCTAQGFCTLHKHSGFVHIYFTCDATVQGCFNITSPTSLVTLSFNNCIWIDLNCCNARFYYLRQ